MASSRRPAHRLDQHLHTIPRGGGTAAGRSWDSPPRRPRRASAPTRAGRPPLRRGGDPWSRRDVGQPKAAGLAGLKNFPRLPDLLRRRLGPAPLPGASLVKRLRAARPGSRSRTLPRSPAPCQPLPATAPRGRLDAGRRVGPSSSPLPAAPALPLPPSTRRPLALEPRDASAASRAPRRVGRSRLWTGDDADVGGGGGGRGARRRAGHAQRVCRLRRRSPRVRVRLFAAVLPVRGRGRVAARARADDFDARRRLLVKIGRPSADGTARLGAAASPRHVREISAR